MAEKKTQKKANVESVPTPRFASTVIEEQREWHPGDAETMYVVVRHTYGLEMRVSDKEYKTENDPKAISERDFWTRAINFRPDGTRMEIVKYDKRKHRTW